MLSAPDHHALRTELRFDGSALPLALSARRSADDEGHGVTVSHATPSGGKPVHRVQLGLRHKWFSASGRPARRGNYVDLLLDGEEAYARVHSDLVAAKSEVLASTWWWESSFELVRPKATHADDVALGAQSEHRVGGDVVEPGDEACARGPALGPGRRALGLHDRRRAEGQGGRGERRLRVHGASQPDAGQVPLRGLSLRLRRSRGASLPDELYDDEPLIASTVKPKDVDLTQWPIEIDTEHASMHQKFMVIDHEVAHIGGMNLRRVDWDTSEHLVFEPRRMLIDASNWKRAPRSRRRHVCPTPARARTTSHAYRRAGRARRRRRVPEALGDREGGARRVPPERVDLRGEA
jgi:hypothetical protein